MLKNNISVLYIDSHVLVVDKPAGIVTQPTSLTQDSLETRAKQWLKQEFKKQGNVFLHAVHRLDRSVSGVVLCARSSKGLARLNESLQRHLFIKKYRALVEGIGMPSQAELTHYLRKTDFRTEAAFDTQGGGQKAVLRYEVVCVVGGNTLLEVTLVTGRYHQIRAQLALIGHPVVGDQKYGSRIAAAHLLLHHAQLSFPHPIHHHAILCTAPLPPYWPMGTCKSIL